MSALAALLKTEAALVVRFRDTLLREQEILRAGTSDELAEINSQKLALADNLNKIGAERTQALTAAKDGTIDMAAWFAAHPREAESRKLWEGLLVVAREAREINEVNGSLINALHQKTSDALAILTRSESEQSLYSRDGQSAASTGSRIIDSA